MAACSYSLLRNILFDFKIKTLSETVDHAPKLMQWNLQPMEFPSGSTIENCHNYQTSYNYYNILGSHTMHHIHPPKSIVPQLCKHSKDASLDSLYDIMHRVQSSVTALTNVTTYYKALVTTATLLCTILKTFVLFCIMLERSWSYIILKTILTIIAISISQK